jgi:biopolymer transport protein ExbD
MAHVATPRDRRSVDLEINLIPFVDVLSCLTAFLMVAAVWVNIARIEIRPAGRGPGACLDGDCERPQLSVLLSTDEIWVGVSRVDDARRIPRTEAGHDWAALEQTLALHKASSLFHDRTDIEVAATSRPGHPLLYRDLIAAMDLAVKTGFLDVGITEPQGLSARP